VVAAHTRFNGDPQPSPEDRDLTQRLSLAAEAGGQKARQSFKDGPCCPIPRQAVVMHEVEALEGVVLEA
jgi:hypothetical protein